MRVSDPVRSGDLAVAGFAAQLDDDLVDLAQARRTDRLTVGHEAAVGVDRQPAADLGGAVGDELLLLAVGAEPVLREVDDLRPGVGVLQLDDVHVRRAEPGGLERGARRVDGRLGAAAAGSDGLCISNAPKRRVRSSAAKTCTAREENSAARSRRHRITAAAPSLGAQYMYWVSG